MDPGGLRQPLPPPLPGNCDCEGDHLRRLPYGWNPIPEGDTYLKLTDVSISYIMAYASLLYILITKIGGFNSTY